MHDTHIHTHSSLTPISSLTPPPPSPGLQRRRLLSDASVALERAGGSAHCSSRKETFEITVYEIDNVEHQQRSEEEVGGVNVVEEGGHGLI